MNEPITELDARYSSETADPTSWKEALRRLDAAEVFWLSTVRVDARPHVTPLIAVQQDGDLYFCTGPEEQKAKNLAANPHCILTTGGSALGEGLDIVVEGMAERVTDEDKLRRLAGAYLDKYGDEWRFDVRDGTFHHPGGAALVYQLRPATAYGFGKGEAFSHTRWRFSG